MARPPGKGAARHCVLDLLIYWLHASGGHEGKNKGATKHLEAMHTHRQALHVMAYSTVCWYLPMTPVPLNSAISITSTLAVTAFEQAQADPPRGQR